MTDTLKLKALMLMKGFTLKTLSKEINISYSTLSNKINNNSEFRQSEIDTLCNLLDIDDEGRTAIFFKSDVELNSTK